MRRTEGLDQARAFIEAHFSEPLTLEQMAAPAALSISRFATAFRERFGSSPYRYLCGLRIKRAQSLLLAGVPSIAVAAELGFFDQSHFGRHFKRICGVTPTMFVANALAKHGAPSKLVTAALVLGPTARFADGVSGPAGGVKGRSTEAGPAPQRLQPLPPISTRETRRVRSIAQPATHRAMPHAIRRCVIQSANDVRIEFVSARSNALSIDAYPIEIDFPKIEAHANGNTGVDYMHTFDSGVPGPHVMINALTHGNEVCGAIVVDALLRFQLRPRRGRLTLSFANVQAYARFDPAQPDKSRYVDGDFNRVWMAPVLDDFSRRSVELDRARTMRPVIDTVDFLLDLHSMHEKSKPLIVAGPLDKGIELAVKLGTPATVICDEGHPEGRRMRDYGGFGEAGSAKNALLIECGQHWEQRAVEVARDCTGRFLLLCGVIDESDLPPGWIEPLPRQMTVVRVTEPVVAESMDFRFAGNYTGLETFAKAGTVIAWSDGEPVVTPYDDCMLVMPSLRQLRPGVTVVRLGRIEARVDLDRNDS